MNNKHLPNKPDMHIAYLLIGGNMGDRFKNLELCLKFISHEAGEIFITSDIYQTAAWGKEAQPDFLNQAIGIRTTLMPNMLLQTLLGIEIKMGRIREEKYGPRLIDIDIIFYNDNIIHHSNLQIPHPQMAFRRFVLLPLAEIAPNYVHPTTNITVLNMLASCSDALDVQKINVI